MRKIIVVIITINLKLTAGYILGDKVVDLFFAKFITVNE